MRGFFKRGLRGLEPSDTESEKAMNRIPLGAEVMVDAKRPRNIKFHRWWFALCSLVADNMPGNYSAETVCEVLKIRTGHCTAVKTKKGLVYIPKSISFASLDETEFKAFVDRAIKVVVEEILPGTASADLEAAVWEMLSSRAAT